MADIDDELLALAGDDSFSEDEQVVTTDDRDRSSPETKPVKKSTKASTTKKTGASRGKRGNKDDSDEEGEASSGISTPNSLESAPMDESDSESDGVPADMYEGGDRFPLEGKFTDSADRAKIMALPEIKREEILAERAANVERDRQTRALRQLLSAREAGNKKSEKKRKATDAELEETKRKTSRQRTKLGGGRVGEASSGIDNLKRARAEKDDRQRRRLEDRSRNGGHLDIQDQYSDQDADADSEVEWDNPKVKVKAASPDHRDSQSASLRDIERVRLGRSRFAMVCFYPGFNEAMTGCFVRINTGFDRESKQNIYRMAIVKGFTEGRPYALENENGKSFVTSQYVRAAHGKSEREWPFVTCSDGEFTEREWTQYKVACANDDVPPPSFARLDTKIADINNLINRRWTEEELQEKLKRSGVLESKFKPIERNRLTNLMKAAKASGDHDKAEQFRLELTKLDGPKLAFGTSLNPSPLKTRRPDEMTQQDKLAQLNRENRKKNTEDVRKAQIKETQAARAIAAALARGESVEEDTSKRHKTRAKFKHDVNDIGKKIIDSDRSGTNTPLFGTPRLEAKKDNASVPQLTALRKRTTDSNGVPGFSRPVTFDEIIQSMDFDIDEDLGL